MKAWGVDVQKLTHDGKVVECVNPVTYAPPDPSTAIAKLSSSPLLPRYEEYRSVEPSMLSFVMKAEVASIPIVDWYAVVVVGKLEEFVRPVTSALSLPSSAVPA